MSAKDLLAALSVVGEILTKHDKTQNVPESVYTLFGTTRPPVA